ncbi:amino acid transporter [Rummeliibacillus pycnus]|uniref:amino acid transporter n=1 Tax=Rummeliibacillus pycnus TaxID=101070 RepID=UPI000C9CECA8|nr:amino acid transporter [Rummeliibacillus pycnus]
MEEEKKPFNDVIDHLNKIEGNPTNGDFKKLPKPLKYIGYVMIVLLLIPILLTIVFKLSN